MESLANAVALYQSGSLVEAEAECEFLVSRQVEVASCLALLGDIRLAAGRPADAVVALTALTQLLPDQPGPLRRLGTALISAGRAGEAVAALGRAIELEPDNHRAHNNMGHALLEAAKISEAIPHFQNAVRLHPTYAAGFSNLGMAWTRAGDYESAVSAFQRAIELDATLIAAHLNLGAAYEHLNRSSEALEIYGRVVNSWPGTFDAWVAQGLVLLSLNRPQAALKSFDVALQLRPGSAQAHKNRAAALLRAEQPALALLAVDSALHLQNDWAEALEVKAAALSRLNQPWEALQALEAALTLEPNYVEAWCDLSVVHQMLGDDEAAIRCLRHALKIDSRHDAARFALVAAQIPSVALSESASREARRAFDAELSTCERWLQEHEIADISAWSMARQPFFYLSYQEESNKSLLQRYRQASSERLSRVSRSGNHTVIAGNGCARRLKIAFISAQLYDHSVFNAITQGWLQNLDRETFEISMFCVGMRQEASIDGIAATAEHFEAGTRTPAEWVDFISAKNLDAIIYPEIGIDRTTLALASLRLAGRQLVAWGHPETSGLPTIDEFISADAFEPDRAEEHYSEQLVRLPNLGVFYQPFAVDSHPLDLSRFGIPRTGPVLVCPGVPFKYRPQDDAVWVKIAVQLGRCSFVFFQHERTELSKKFRRRLSAAFSATGLDADRFIHFVPWLPRAEFLALMERADVYLDTLGFSGFNTFMLAVQARLPGVAFEGKFMRGRLGSGILRRLGLPELIADTPESYVAIAVRLAEDPDYRAQIRLALREREALAYRDHTVIDALSKVLSR